MIVDYIGIYAGTTDGGDIDLKESELYKELGILTKNKSKWEENIPFVSSLLNHESVKIQAKALWLLGEMGLEYPDHPDVSWEPTCNSSQLCFVPAFSFLL